MKTTHEIELSIDDKVYNLTVKDLNKKEKLRLKQIADEVDAKRKNFTKKRQELLRLSNEIELNEQIKANSKTVDIELLKEIKSLYDKYYKLSSEVSALEEQSLSDDDAKDLISKEALNMRLGGKDKEIFIKDVFDLSIDADVVFKEIALKVKEAEEKK